MVKVLAVAHVAFEGLASFEEVFRARGAQITELVSCVEDISAVDPKAHDVAVILGGSMGVYQADIFPYLKSELKYIEARLKDDLPILGICLGSQLMAKALGADVYPGKQGKEIGWYPLTLTEEGKESPVCHLAGDKTPMLHWHGDTFDFPDGATLLASSEKYKYQAYRWGKNAIATQCHPEVTAHSLEQWLASGGFSAIEHNGQTVPDFRAQNVKNAPVLQSQSALFLNEWLDSLNI